MKLIQREQGTKVVGWLIGDRGSHARSILHTSDASRMGTARHGKQLENRKSGLLYVRKNRRKQGAKKEGYAGRPNNDSRPTALRTVKAPNMV